jgi:cellulose synthase/poly-beta-1,6-N-acetylglucosamine synthase-like glycosyltransferase
MLSILLAIRNNRTGVTNCLASLQRVIAALALPTEFILVDDDSDPAQQIPQLLLNFRNQLGATVLTRIVRFTQHQHYTRALAYGLSAAKGEHVLFISHDMIATPDYVRTLLAVGAADETIGLVRGVSQYVDCFPEHIVRPPMPMRSFEDLNTFAEYVARYCGLHYVEDRLLTGDSMLIRRAALDKIGVFDCRYFGYFGDIDFGLRLQRAGLKLVCAKGAWLWHEGAGAYKSDAETQQRDLREVHDQRMQVVNAAYHLFRDKWSTDLPPDYPGVKEIDFARLRQLPRFAADDFIAPVTPAPSIAEWL